MSRKHTVIIDKDLNDFILGSRLGDASFIKKSKNHNTYICFSHCERQYEYLKWKYDFLKQHNCLNKETLIKPIRQESRMCYMNAQKQYRFDTFSSEDFNKYFDLNNIDIIKQINCIGLAVFVLDDGNFYKKTCKISTSGKKYNSEFYNSFISMLYTRFNIKSFIYLHPTNTTKNYIRIPASEFEKLKEIITSVINCTFVKEKLYA